MSTDAPAPMRLALECARRALDSGDVPVGAVVTVRGGGGRAGETVVGQGWNTREVNNDPTGHAEVEAIRAAAARLGRWRLDDCVLYVTLEPCVMCAGAILAARIPKVVFGAWDEKAGASGSQFDLLRERRLNHRCEVVPGVLAEEGERLLLEFFRGKR